jgi:hypothetical protein
MSHERNRGFGSIGPGKVTLTEDLSMMVPLSGPARREPPSAPGKVTLTERLTGTANPKPEPSAIHDAGGLGTGADGLGAGIDAMADVASGPKP